MPLGLEQKSALEGGGLVAGKKMVMDACHLQTSTAEITSSIVGRGVKECHRSSTHLEVFKF